MICTRLNWLEGLTGVAELDKKLSFFAIFNLPLGYFVLILFFDRFRQQVFERPCLGFSSKNFSEQVCYCLHSSFRLCHVCLLECVRLSRAYTLSLAKALRRRETKLCSIFLVILRIFLMMTEEVDTYLALSPSRVLVGEVCVCLENSDAQQEQL